MSGMRDRDRGVFAISVAADLVSMQVQNLRVYERHGLVTPDRSEGGTRRYSEADLEVLHRIRELLADGLNLAGIAAVFRLEAENERLRDQLERARSRG
jgi:MerR family transcriptional regulator, heat shock protein HspR